MSDLERSKWLRRQINTLESCSVNRVVNADVLSQYQKELWEIEDKDKAKPKETSEQRAARLSELRRREVELQAARGAIIDKVCKEVGLK